MLCWTITSGLEEQEKEKKKKKVIYFSKAALKILKKKDF